MKRKIAYISIFFAIAIIMLSCSAYASNVLIISEEDVVHGKTVATMLGQIAPDDFTVEEVSIENGKSISQTVDGINTAGNKYDSVIIQPQLEGMKDVFVSDYVEAVKKLEAQNENNGSTKYYISTPVGKILSLSNQEQEIDASVETVEKIVSELSTLTVSKIPVYEILKEANDGKYLEVCSDNKLTTIGDLLVACSYSNWLGKKVTNLTSYNNLTDADVQSVVDLANEWEGSDAEIPEADVVDETTNSLSEDAANTSNNTNNTNTSNANTTNSTSAEDRANVGTSEGNDDIVTFRTDREPRLTYIKEKSDYLFIEIRDMAGIACEYPSYYMGEKCEASKSMQPQIYYYENDKRGNTVSGLRRPAEDEYKLVGKEYVYTIGLPVSEISKEFKKFEIVAYDVKSPYKKSQYFIDEVFMVKKSDTGELTVNRAPTSFAVTTKSALNQMGLQVADGTGVSTIDMKTLPKGVGEYNETIRTWNGRAEDNWSVVTKVTTNGEYVKEGITLFEKIDTIFKKSSWVGLNPKLAEEDGVYVVLVTAEDASGACSVKTMNFDTRYYIDGETYVKTGNGTVTEDVKNVYNPKSYPKKTTSKDTKNDSSETSSKNNSKTSSDGNSGSSSGGSSGSSSGGSSGGSSEESKEEKESEEKKKSSSDNSLKKGSKGEEVKKLQKRLNAIGKYGLEEDGDFGTNTEKAVKDYQSKHGLTVDGIVGEKTWKKLNSSPSEIKIKLALNNIGVTPIDLSTKPLAKLTIEYPTGTINKGVNWKVTSGGLYITVKSDINGDLIINKKVGAKIPSEATATISATSVANGKISDKITLHIGSKTSSKKKNVSNSNKNAPTKITITREKVVDIIYPNSITNSNDKKNPVKLKVNCEPSGSNPGTIKWEITNGKDMAKVTSNGEVYITKKKPSMANISVKATTKNGGISATYNFLYKP